MFAVYGGYAPSDILRKYNYFFINGFYYNFTMRNTFSAIPREGFERIDGEGQFLADLGILMLDDRSVEIDCDGHRLLCFLRIRRFLSSSSPYP